MDRNYQNLCGKKLFYMEGVAAVGTEQGSVYLVDLRFKNY